MVFVNQIQSILSKYNHNWFLEMKTKFREETWYDKKQDKIVIEYSSNQSYYNHDTNDLEIEEETVTFSLYTLDEFCWSYTNRHFSEEEYSSKFNDDSFFIHACFEIISITQELLNQVGSIDEKDKLITSIINLIIDEFEKLSLEKDDEYKNLLSFLIQKVRSKFGKHFISIKDINSFIKEYHDKLEFNLNQDELAILICMLIDTDILSVHLSDDRNIKNFAKQYFYYTNSKKEVRPAINIARKISDYIPDSTIDKVKDKLRKALIYSHYRGA